MSEERPDPDDLLARLREDQQRAARGKLKIFFGASAGVGKTYAMLSSARQLLRQGVDTVIGLVETHGRAETAVLLEGLEILPRRQVPYRDRVIEEFDIDAALARRPGLILVDELAHSNAAGSRHPKRWQDVEELLAAGIDVLTTVNVQHLETLNDVVGAITGIRVLETVPDQVFDAADEVVLVDLPPDELLQRLREGKVYLPQQAERAIRNFFRKGNLIALRELALRRTADRVDSQMLAYRRDRSVAPVWRARESLLACIGPDEGGDRIVRSAARIAAHWDVPWHAVYVETPLLRGLSERRREHVLRCLKLAQDAGAETASLSGGDAVEAIVQYARDHNLSRVVLGRPRPGRRLPWHRSLTERLALAAPDMDITLVAQADAPARGVDEPVEESWFERLQAPWTAFAMSAAFNAVTVLLASALMPYFDLANIAMLFLLAVLLAAVRYGRGPAVLAAVLNVATFDFFFVPPRFSFAVSDVQYLLTFFVMLVVGLITAKFAGDLRHQARVANVRERRVRALYEMARELSGALMIDQIVEISRRFARTGFGAGAAIVLGDEGGGLGTAVGPTEPALPIDRGICQWAFDHGQEAGVGTDTLPGSALLYLPLRAPMRMRGVLVLEPADPRTIRAPEQRRLLDTFARLVAIALERIHFVDVAQATTVQIESERLRNSLLAAISHDLRTPLSVMVGLADSLLLAQPEPSGQQREIAASMREEVLRMSALVNNLLDMARLQSGSVTLRREWQPLEEVVGSALRAVGPLLAPRPVTVRIPDELPLLEFDALLIERVFVNLLENAAKYTPPQTHVQIGAAVADGMAQVWVQDDGPGLPVGREEEIFEKFARGSKESSTPGVGLGLAICRAIIQAHGGAIHAQQQPEGGARFVFTLPLGNPPTVRDAQAPVADAIKSLPPESRGTP